MIDIDNVKKQFENFLSKYDNLSNSSYLLKITHTLNVVDNTRKISKSMNLPNEDIELAQLIAYLHDIGRFEEIAKYKGFESVKNDHAMVASKILFEDNHIRDFITDNSYDNIIKIAIENHNKLNIEPNLSDKELLHAKLLRDSDKLDIFRVIKDSSVDSLFAGRFSSIEEFNDSLISENVYNSVIKNECVKTYDRVYPLDYLICVLAFVFDINFKETLKIIEENNLVDDLINKYDYSNIDSINKIENIRRIIKDYIKNSIKGDKNE